MVSVSQEKPFWQYSSSADLQSIIPKKKQLGLIYSGPGLTKEVESADSWHEWKMSSVIHVNLSPFY